jgi:hypothetical protein
LDNGSYAVLFPEDLDLRDREGLIRDVGSAAKARLDVSRRIREIY